MDTFNKLNMMTADIVDENVKKIAELFPNAVTEVGGKYAIDFDVLKQELSKDIVEGREERYEFTWPDKRKTIRLANAPISSALRPCIEESVDFETTENLYIEGDNLDVLKLLRETYLKKIKMIYIDPPYNTGNDFIYKDKYSMPKDEYDSVSGEYDDESNRLVANKDSNGRFHTDWLNMIYPRLRLAKALLTDDGVIFISIDDNEVHNMRKICDEVFGESNFVAEFVWKSKLGKVGTTSTISTTHEYILCYGKNAESLTIKMIEEENEGRRENLRQWGQADSREDRPSMWYPITIDGIEVYPIKEDGSEGRWRVGKEKADELLASSQLEFSNKGGRYNIYRNFEAGVSVTAYETMLLDEIGTTANGALSLKELNLNKTFDYSKPIELIRFFALLSTRSDDIILDFFSGSATTAHAVMQLNAEDGGNRKFIMVQLAEDLDESLKKASGDNKQTLRNAIAFCDSIGVSHYLSEIGKERIRRAGKKIKDELSSKKIDVESLTDDAPRHTAETLDTGFRVLKLDSSNMKEVYYYPNEHNGNDLERYIDNIKSDRTPLDLLFQIMLELGVSLSSKISHENMDGKTVYTVTYEGANYIKAVFDEDVPESVITAMAKTKPYHAVITNKSMSKDSMVVNFEQIFKEYSPDTRKRII